MWNVTTTLYLDDTSIRLLVSQGLKIKKWAEMQLEPGLITDSVVNQEGEVALRVKNLLKSQKVNGRHIALGFSGLHSLTRPTTLPQLPKNMLPEAVFREARRVLPVPIDQMYIAWRQIPCPRGKTRIFIAATPRKTFDSMVKTLKMAGVEPHRASIKPLVLTKSLPVNNAVLIDLQPAEFDIVIMVDGIAQPVRTVSLPQEELSWSQKLNMVINDLDRTIKFYDTNNPEKPLDSALPIYCSGVFTEKPEMLKPLAESTSHPVNLLTPNFKGIEQLDLSRYGVNVALAVNAQNPSREIAFPIANLNMLPTRYQPKPISMAKVVGIPAGAAAVAIAIPLIMTLQSNAANIATVQNQLDITNQMVNQKLKQKAELNAAIVDLQKKVTAKQKEVENLKLTLQSLHGHQEYVSGDLLATLSNLPEGITLSSIVETGSGLALCGSAPTEAAVHEYAQIVLQYARTLQSTARYTQTTINSLKISPPEKGAVTGRIDFTLTLGRGS
jgi:type IV pilus assembly protein PilM